MNYLIGSLLFICYLFTMFAIVHTKKDTSIGNFTWGGGVLLLTIISFAAGYNGYARQIMVTVCITLWCSRLAYYVWLRYKRGADPRYVSWLATWKNPVIAFLFSFGWVVMLNGFFALVMSAPSLAINLTMMQPTMQFADILGLIVWFFGFIFESISDYQLYVFMQNPANKGTILQSGL